MIDFEEELKKFEPSMEVEEAEEEMMNKMWRKLYVWHPCGS